MTTHHVSCHCGAVQFDVDHDLSGLVTCNCSLCGRSGAIMAFVPREALSGLQGEDHLVDYQFGKKSIHHTFCRTCGMRPVGFGTMGGQPLAMVNLRCAEGVDAHTLSIAQQYDGRAL